LMPWSTSGRREQRYGCCSLRVVAVGLGWLSNTLSHWC
jgi:hypothetical protein